MRVDGIVVLQEIYQNCLSSRKEINDKLQNNKNRICEMDAFIRSLRDNEEVDYKFFSPRNAESIYGDRIKEVNTEKANIEKENKEYYRKLNHLDKEIEQLELLMKNSSENNETVANEANVNVATETDVSSLHFKVLDIQEKERQRIARELHDSSVQNMTHLIHMIELSSMFIDQDPVRAKLELASCTKNLKEIIDEVRDTIFNLRPMSFDDLGFKQSIDDLVSNAKIHYGNHNIIYEAEDIIDIDQCEDKAAANLFLVTVYRVVQEALLNSLKHSEAEVISLTIKSRDSKLFVEISDNGKGFDLERIYEQKDRHFGISVMKERIDLLGGTVEIVSEPEKGTRISIEIPLCGREEK